MVHFLGQDTGFPCPASLSVMGHKMTCADSLVLGIPRLTLPPRIKIKTSGNAKQLCAANLWQDLPRSHIYFFLYFIYFFMRDRGRGRDIGRGRSSCREPNVGLDPRTLGSCPEQKADAQPLSHPGILMVLICCLAPLLSLMWSVFPACLQPPFQFLFFSFLLSHALGT